MTLSPRDLHDVHRKASAPVKFQQAASRLGLADVEGLDEQLLIQPLKALIDPVALQIPFVEIGHKARFGGYIGRGQPAAPLDQEYDDEHYRQHPHTADAEQCLQRQKHDEDDQQIAQRGKRDERKAVVAVFDPQSRIFGRVQVEHRPDKERPAHNAEECTGGADHPFVQWSTPQQRSEHEPAQKRYARHQNAVKSRNLDIATQKAQPVAVFFNGTVFLAGIAFQLFCQLCGKKVADQTVDLFRILDQKRRCQRRDDGHGDHDGIEMVGDHAEVHTKGRDDKGKLADLGQRTAAAHGPAETLPGQQHAQ